MVDFAALRARLAASSPAQSVPAPATIPTTIVTTETIAKEMTEKQFIPVAPKIPSKLGFELQEKVLSLQASLLDRHPRMPVLLREIHTTLRAQPENVTLMSEEEIAIIVDGLKIQTSVEFATAITKNSSTKSLNTKIKQLGLGAF